MAEPLVMADSSDKNSEDSSSSSPPCSRKCGEGDMWSRIFRDSDRPITLTDLLESSPEAQQLKKHNFHLHSDNNISWSGSFSIGGHPHRKRNNNPSSSSSSSNILSFNHNFPSSSSTSIHSIVNTKLASVLTSSSSLCHPPPPPSTCSSSSSSSTTAAATVFQKFGKRKLESDEDHDHGGWEDSLSKTFPMNVNECESVRVVQSKCMYKIKRNCVLQPNMRPKYFQVTSGRLSETSSSTSSSIDSFYHHHLPLPGVTRVPCPQRKQRVKKTTASVGDKEMVAEVSSTVAHL